MPGYREGWIHVQDEASQLISLILDPQPGERILDLCAGFGGKTTHAGILMENTGEIVAVDQSSWKLQELQQNARRQGLTISHHRCRGCPGTSPCQVGTF